MVESCLHNIGLFWGHQEEAPQSKRRRNAGSTPARAPEAELHVEEPDVEELEVPMNGVELLDTQASYARPHDVALLPLSCWRCPQQAQFLQNL